MSALSSAELVAYLILRLSLVDTETDYPDAPEGPNTLWHGGKFNFEAFSLNQTVLIAKQETLAINWAG